MAYPKHGQFILPGAFPDQVFPDIDLRCNNSSMQCSNCKNTFFDDGDVRKQILMWIVKVLFLELILFVVLVS